MILDASGPISITVRENGLLNGFFAAYDERLGVPEIRNRFSKIDPTDGLPPPCLMARSLPGRPAAAHPVGAYRPAVKTLSTTKLRLRCGKICNSKYYGDRQAPCICPYYRGRVLQANDCCILETPVSSLEPFLSTGFAAENKKRSLRRSGCLCDGVQFKIY